MAAAWTSQRLSSSPGATLTTSARACAHGRPAFTIGAPCELLDVRTVAGSPAQVKVTARVSACAVPAMRITATARQLVGFDTSPPRRDPPVFIREVGNERRNRPHTAMAG